MNAANKPSPVSIKPPNFGVVHLKIVGTAPYMQARFSHKAMTAIHDKMAAGSQAKKGRTRAPRDFQSDYEGAMHISTDGWNGIPASAFRCACISACRTVGFKMTLAKLSIFIKADGFDRLDGMPLVKIEGKPEPSEMAVRNATGVVDLRCRPMWREWGANLDVQFDMDQFSEDDICNLIARAGMQVGIGEGRPDSRSSAGLGFGLFEIK